MNHGFIEGVQEHTPRTLLPEKIEDESGNLVDNVTEIPDDKLQKVLSEDLKCPICRGSLDTTIAIAACLHRFCSDCFQRSIRDYKQQHQCPICRKSLASRRSSKPDKTVDDLVNSLNTYLGNNNSSETIKQEQNQHEGDKNSSPSRKKPRRSESPGEEILLQKQIEEFRLAYLQRVEEFKARQKEIRNNPALLSESSSSYYYNQHFNSMKKSQSKLPTKSKATRSKDHAGNNVSLALFPFPHVRETRETHYYSYSHSHSHSYLFFLSGNQKTKSFLISRTILRFSRRVSLCDFLI
jgi:hypothetical protein